MAAEIIITSRTRRSATGRHVTLRFDRGKATSSSVGNSPLSLLTYPSWRVVVAPLAQKRNDGPHVRGIRGSSRNADCCERRPLTVRLLLRAPAAAGRPPV